MHFAASSGLLFSRSEFQVLLFCSGCCAGDGGAKTTSQLALFFGGVHTTRLCTDSNASPIAIIDCRQGFLELSNCLRRAMLYESVTTRFCVLGIPSTEPPPQGLSQVRPHDDEET